MFLMISSRLLCSDVNRLWRYECLACGDGGQRDTHTHTAFSRGWNVVPPHGEWFGAAGFCAFSFAPRRSVSLKP